MARDRVDLFIRGEHFIVRTNNDEPEVTAEDLHDAARSVSEKIDLVLQQSGFTLSSSKAAMYVALMCAVEAETQRKVNANLRRQLGVIAQDASDTHHRNETLKRQKRGS
ncbi:MAG: cell division protein ZapA [Oscillospiraceae bacterium]|jgi:hypothetical protein|nr:cell division protein ZapA [Oscillospiraceae bacterium]